MKKTLLLLYCLAISIATWSIPAIPWNISARQPDGTTLTVRIIGDEYYHRYTTTDGLTLEQNTDGSYTYVDNRMHNTGVLAHNPEIRPAQEIALTANINPNLTDAQQVQQAQHARRQANAIAHATTRFDYSKFRGLVILVNYNDRQLSMANPNAFFDAMLNQPDYSGYGDDSTLADAYSNFTGSVRDYFYDNSDHKFEPHFDVVGPINIDHPITYPARTSNGPKMFAEVLQLADDQIDYSQYDTDGDGYVDMVYFIVAGPGSNSGAPSSYLWPHKSSLSATLDGVKLATYACSTEMLLVDGNEVIDGVGTICHEFGHVLGLPDLYDTDYATSGQSTHPSKWEIMASGSYLNNSRTPAGYSLYDKYSLGFATPQVIDATGTYTLSPLGTTHQGYILPTPNTNEKFLLENRQPTKWDSYLPGHGLIVARLDSSSLNVWESNKVNCDITHNYYQLLRAGVNTSGTFDSDSDPYPGTQNVTQLTNQTTPNLQTWDHQYNALMLANIQETSVGGNIVIDVTPSSAAYTLIEDFETMPTSTDKGQTGVEGRFSHWDFSKCRIEAPSDSTLCHGKQALALFKNAEAYLTDTIDYAIARITMSINNPNTAVMNISLEYLPEGEDVWIAAKDVMTQQGTAAIAANSVTECSFDLNLNRRTLLRLTTTGGSSTKACYLDDMTLHCTKKIDIITPEPTLTGDINGDGVVDVSDVNILINIVLGKDYAANYDERPYMNDDDVVDVSDINILINIILGK